jgi:AcrR family transcriptional regulator
MQHLKEEVRRKIIEAGRAEFMAKGFAAASMREIAERAGVVAGNVYRYFPGKDALFEAIVGPAHKSLLSLVKANSPVDRKAVNDFRAIEPTVELLLEACRAYHTELSLLAQGSEGTPYANTREELVAHIEGRLASGLLSPRDGGKKNEDSFILHVMAATFIDGFLMILREQGRDPSAMDRSVRRLLALFFKDLKARLT